MIHISSKNSHNAGKLCENLFYQIRIDDKNYEVKLSANRRVLIENMETALALALPAAMRLNFPVHVEGTISRQYLKNMTALMAYYAEHFKDFHTVPISSSAVIDYEVSPKNNAGSFFSGGVDSFYTLFKHLNEIDSLIVLYGFDIKLKDAVKIEKTKQATRSLAQVLDKELIEITGNFTHIITDYCHWVSEGHGFALAAAARALAGSLDKVYISSTFPASNQIPWGSSIMTDQLHADAAISIIHDADENDRIDKLIFIADYPIALKNLRVCGDIPYDGNYNCSQCEKCVRTMLQLWSINKLEQATSFHLPLTPKIVRNTLLNRENLRAYYRQALLVAQKNRPQEKAMLKAIETVIARPLWLSTFMITMRRKRKHLNRNIKNILAKLI